MIYLGHIAFDEAHICLDWDTGVNSMCECGSGKRSKFKKTLENVPSGEHSESRGLDEFIWGETVDREGAFKRTLSNAITTQRATEQIASKVPRDEKQIRRRINNLREFCALSQRNSPFIRKGMLDFIYMPERQRRRRQWRLTLRRCF